MIFKLIRKHKAKKYRQLQNASGKACHFSIDDVIDIFKDLTKNETKYESIFDNQILAYLKYLHHTYGLSVSMYTYYKDREFSLDKATDRFSKEFFKNSSWLRFGFHAKDAQVNYAECSEIQARQDYEMTLNELLRICGGEECITQVVRLSRFQGSNDCIHSMKNARFGIKGLLTADDNRGSYYLNAEQEKKIKEFRKLSINNLDFHITDFRVEYFDLLRLNKYRRNNSINFFTHEYFLTSKRFQNKIEKILLELVKNGFNFIFY